MMNILNRVCALSFATKYPNMERGRNYLFNIVCELYSKANPGWRNVWIGVIKGIRLYHSLYGIIQSRAEDGVLILNQLECAIVSWKNVVRKTVVEEQRECRFTKLLKNPLRGPVWLLFIVGDHTPKRFCSFMWTDLLLRFYSNRLDNDVLDTFDDLVRFRHVRD